MNYPVEWRRDPMMALRLGFRNRPGSLALASGDSIPPGEDEALLRRGLTLLLEDAGFVVAATATDVTALLELTDELRPDMVITAVRMPPTHTDEGMVAALQIARKHRSTSVVVLS